MKKENLLDAMNYIDPEMVEEAAGYTKAKKAPMWYRWSAAAACLCLFIVSFAFYSGTKEQKPVSVFTAESETVNGLPKIRIPDFENEGMGFEALLYHDISELKNSNPWTVDQKIDTLPVFKNPYWQKAYPAGLSETEMEERLRNAADALQLTVSSIDYRHADLENEKQVYMISANTEAGTLDVYADGTVVFRALEGVSLPEGYRFAHTGVSDAEAEEALDYLIEKYQAFHGFEHPKAALDGDYSITDEYARRYWVYDETEDLEARILNYWFRPFSFGPNDAGNLMVIRKEDGLCKAEKIGSYPLISIDEAKEKLFAGEYQTSVPEDMSWGDEITEGELVYRSGRTEKIWLPYYRFYVKLQTSDNLWQETGLYCFGAYYVPAISKEYIAEESEYHYN